MQKLLILNFGMGNIHSVVRTFKNMDVEVIVSGDPAEIKKADKIIIPGVGHFQTAIKNIEHLNIMPSLNEFALVNKKPILGICLGMQLMGEQSEEGGGNGFGWITGSVIKFKSDLVPILKVPNIGWNSIEVKLNSALTRGIGSEDAFYFIHSYHFVPSLAENILAETKYGENFTSAIQKENLYGVQFHPEKSYGAGEKLMRNFINL